MRQVWTSDEHCTLDEIPFEYGRKDYASLHTTEDKIWVLKPRGFFDLYDRLLNGIPPKRVLEVGIFEGGSAFLLADRWANTKISAFDIRQPNAAVSGHNKRFGFDDRLSLHYGVSQDDADSVLGIIDGQLDGGPDLVIDDASHQYQLSRRTFEIVFPCLAQNGLYVVEDLAWAHWKEYQDPAAHPWTSFPALSNLLFEICMLAGSAPHLISEVIVSRPLFAVRKAAGVLSEPFRIEDHYASRRRQLNTI